jgi:DNA processing protein
MNDGEGKAWLALAATKGIGPQALWKLAGYLMARQKTASWLLANPEAMRDALPGGRARLGPPFAAGPDDGERGQGREAAVLHPLHPAFPPRLIGLKDRLPLPAILYARGDLSLLGRPSVSIVGQRAAENRALAAAGGLASRLAAGGVHVTSGYAAGIDSAAHLGALQEGGTTTLVLAEGIGRFRARPEFKDLLTAENALLLSQFAPGDEWAPYRAMARNRLVCALSGALVVIASGPERDPGGRRSGTFDAALSALKLDLPLFVVDPSFFRTCPGGNRELIRRGGRSWDPGSGVSPILDALKHETACKVPDQRKLF